MRSLKILLAAALVAASASTAIAQPMVDTCRGTLMQRDGDVIIGDPHDEGMCTFDQADDAKKIMAVCRIGQHCEVAGMADYCKEEPECVAITNVTKVTTQHTRR